MGWQGGSRTLYFVFTDIDVRRGLDDVTCEVVDHGDGVLQSLPVPVVGGSNMLGRDMSGM